jgi:hypothetical protein
MWGKLKCFIGWHDWEGYEATRWGETIHYRKCKRPGCRVRQRWHRNDYNNKADKRGYWA